MKNLLVLFVFCLAGIAGAQNYPMQNGSIVTCSGTFYDSGGALGNYTANENYQITFCPPAPGNYIQLIFTEFDLEGEPFDYLRIYNGPNTSGALLATFGNTAPAGCDIIASSHPSGCITVVFQSDPSVQLSGWAASISCSPTPGGTPIPIPANALCGGASPFCADSGPLEFPNIPDGCAAAAPIEVATYTCLLTAPNPAWYFLEVDVPGTLNLSIEQTTGPAGTGVGLDVDYAIWGPFSNAAAACADFTLGACAGDHNCFGNVVDCSYSAAAVETATIPNAVVGQVYLVLITNFDGAPGYITMTQTNAGSTGAGSTDCSIVCPVFTGTNPTCGGTNGTITISGLDPTTNYTVSYLDDGLPVTINLLSNAAGFAAITGLNPGTYTNLVTNYAGCAVPTPIITLAGSTNATATVTYSAGPFCNTSTANVVPALTGTGSFSGGTYSAPPGLNINAVTGAINPSLSAVGSYVVTYTLAASGGCSAVTDTETVVISAPATATISYGGPFCASDSTLHNPTLTGTGSFSGGTYSAPPGLNINAVTGAINPSLSAVGSYTVTYTLAASGGCPAVTDTETVVISAPASAIISYGGPFCASDSTSHNPTLAGTGSFSGGTYSAPPGLNINAVTGVINPSLSAIGSYTVTYTLAASGGCPAVTDTATVVISAPATATISYGGPFCASDAVLHNPTLTGTGSFSGGTYSAPPGLNINAVTGAINPSLSAVGIYTVTYTLAASGGCPAVTDTSTVVISAPATATISYGGPFCASDSTLHNPTLTGTGNFSGGTYSAPPGLNINAVTGAINPSLSVAGTFQVIYTISGSGNCLPVNVNTSVMIVASPLANLQYSGPFCASDPMVFLPSLSGSGNFTGGSYSASSGLAVDPVSGAITPSSSLAGSYTVTYLFGGSGGCASGNAIASVVISEPPTINISYAGPFCVTDNGLYAPFVTGTGAFAGGLYSAPPGLAINAVTGEINPSFSSVGIYLVTYTSPAFGSCPSALASTSVTIGSAPVASFTYSGPFCTTDATIHPPLLSGSGAYTGGQFTAPAGLQIDAVTGAVSPSLSSPGIYQVTYSIPPSDGCNPAPVFASVTITQPPTATLAYTGPFCTADTTLHSPILSVSGALSVGSYTAPAGLSINAVSGEINPSMSVAGTYLVNYMISGSGGCAAVNATALVTVTAPAVSSISYAGPFCTSDGTLHLPTLSGSGSFTGGVFSAPSGLSVDTATGTINPMLSTPGSYLVSYTIPGSIGCAMTPATATVVIQSSPTASISYNGPFCANDPVIQSPLLTGSGNFAGGVYSAAPGLSLNGSTGTIDASTSVPGTYAVSYTTSPVGSCPGILASTSVTITPAPSVTIAYNTPFCAGDVTEQTVTISGTGNYLGGSFSAGAGLSIDAVSGGIQPSASVPGTYLVEYTVSAHGCMPVTATFFVQIDVVPTATISYAGPYCELQTIPQPVVLTGTGNYTGGWFTGTFGSGIDAVTGEIFPSQIPPGTHLVIYSLPGSGTCPSVTAQSFITIGAAPSAHLSYAGPYCISDTNVYAPLLTGTGNYTAGSFSAPAGLHLDTVTGEINPSLSNAGAYTVEYTTLTLDGCAAVSTNASITINTLPTASISYSGVFCISNSSPQLVLLTGTGSYLGGHFSSSVGLYIDAATGAINPSLSTPGTYTVTYVCPASAGCSAVSTSTVITINDLPAVTLSYNSPFCSADGPQTAFLSGTGNFTGGHFSAAPGLYVDVVTGTITPSLSIPGTYSVDYTVPASAGCVAVSATAQVVISGLPTVEILYPGAPFCQSAAIQPVQLSGTFAYSGGSFLSTPGLALNGSTGAIDPGASTPGTYAVSYTVPSSGNCPSVVAGTSVTITSPATAMISYNGPYCVASGGAQLVLLSGTSAYLGGNFTADPGLDIDNLTGTIRPGLSAPGIYTVTYSIPASAGCPSAPVTTSVVINATPVAIATASSHALCTGDTVSINLSSDLPGTTYIWTVTQNNVIGASGGSGNLITQTLSLTGNAPGSVEYTIIPTSAFGCTGTPVLFTVTVHPLPTPALEGGVICRNASGVVVRSVMLDTGLDDADHNFVWLYNSAPLPVTGNSCEAVQAGIYTVVATNVLSGCVSYPVDALITETEVADLAIISGNEAFVDNPVVTVTVVGSGNYEYQLDDGVFQTSNVFTGITPGDHIVRVRDQDDCTSIAQTFTVIGYPKFFTPNNDGYNDTWNISALSGQRAKISIFDRYGKLIKQISPSGTGWDGTLQGYALPATDYWFVVEYEDRQHKKEFKSHFALKR